MLLLAFLFTFIGLLAAKAFEAVATLMDRRP